MLLGARSFLTIRPATIRASACATPRHRPFTDRLRAAEQFQLFEGPGPILLE